MDLNRVNTILITLANGFSPNDGSKLPVNSICQDPEVIRALFRAVACINSHLPLPTDQEGLGFSKEDEAPQHFRAWNKTDDDKIALAFQSGTPIREIAEEVGRTRGSVQTRLIRLGVLKLEKHGPGIPDAGF